MTCLVNSLAQKIGVLLTKQPDKRANGNYGNGSCGNRFEVNKRGKCMVGKEQGKNSTMVQLCKK